MAGQMVTRRDAKVPDWDEQPALGIYEAPVEDHPGGIATPSRIGAVGGHMKVSCSRSIEI